MPRFFIRNEQIDNNMIKIIGDDAFHISRSLRMAAGEHITACDEKGMEYDCILERFEPDSVSAKICDVRESEVEPPFFAHVYQGLPKGDKLETVIQKAVECGASSVTPFESEFCIAKSKPEAEEKRKDRRNKIAAEAAKQCGRAVLPRVGSTLSFKEMLDEAKKVDLVLFCYEGEGTVPLGRAIENLPELIKEKGKINISVIVGSEGGFSENEVKAIKDAGFMPCGLGKRILRTETASSFVLSCIVYETEL